MASSMADVMDALGTALETIPDLRVFDFPPKSAQPPFAFVDMPESIDYDLTYGRGADRMTFQVVVGVAAQVDRATRDALQGYTVSVKAAIENLGPKFRVTQATFGAIGLSSGLYWGATFSVDYAG